MPPSAASYRLHHGAPLNDAQAAQLITRTAQGEALNFAAVRRGSFWVLAHLATLSAAERAEFARRVTLAAQLLDTSTVPALLTA